MDIIIEQNNGALTFKHLNHTMDAHSYIIEKLIRRAATKFNIASDFKFAVFVNELSAPARTQNSLYWMGTFAKNYAATFPCYSYEVWPGGGNIDYEELCSSFVDSTPLSSKVGWIGAEYRCRADIINTLKTKYADISDINTYSITGYVKWQQQLDQWKYMLDIPGTTDWSCRLKILLRSPRIVFMIDRKFEEWFFEYLKPWVHYVPVKRDLSDLEENYRKIESDVELQATIKANQKIFADTYLTRDAALDRIKQIMLSDTDMTVFSVSSKSVTPGQVQKQQQWQAVRGTWQQAGTFMEAVKSRGIVATALDVLSVDNTSGERVSDEVLALRKLSCFGDGSEKYPPCISLKVDLAGSQFCGACGCKSNKLAILTSSDPNEYTKLHYPNLQCPLKKPGFSNADTTHLV